MNYKKIYKKTTPRLYLKIRTTKNIARLPSSVFGLLCYGIITSNTLDDGYTHNLLLPQLNADLIVW